MTNALGAEEHFTSAFSAPLNGILYIHKGMYNRILYVYKESGKESERVKSDLAEESLLKMLPMC